MIGKVTKCTNEKEVQGKENQIGGIVGYNEGEITQCRNKGNIKGLRNNIGEIVGLNSSPLNQERNCKREGHIFRVENL